ncbi:MFS transporter [Actinomadura madurae]|uniref:Sugar phosphate permease n=1 Tax=Actinomadura madurae TaxID=1993 RepID=A0A1I5M427_9ACTN|nr:MFS transporter [Actinomadura madurae]SFP04322.1 Sugar phosphate permease [Actinomadura madurae]SPT52317.1 Inner membrane transport protein RhmT [Actinomadura madurae]
MTTGAGAAPLSSAQINRKVSLRIIPFLCLLMFVAYIDRISLAYAGPAGMNEDLGLSATAFGFAAGIFFIGYIAIEVPSNVALHRFGARLWLGRIIITWGVVQMLTAFVPNAETLYVMRFLLGLAEAGFTPGVLLYLTYWFSSEYRGRAITRFLFSVMVTTVIGAPLSMWLIGVGDSAQPLGLTGWRFLILTTGVPAVVMGMIALFYLDDRPQTASWLSSAEKADIQARLNADAEQYATRAGRVRDVLRNGRAWLLGFCFFVFNYGSYALTFFLPTLVLGFQERFNTHYSPVQAALLTSVPFACGGLAQLLYGRHCDRKGKPGAHIAVSSVIGVTGGIGATLAESPLALIAWLCVMAVGIVGAAPLVSVMTSNLYRGVGAAAALGLVNTVGVSSGFFGPYITGWLRDLTGNQDAGIILISVLLVAAGVTGLLVERGQRRQAHALSAGGAQVVGGDDPDPAVARE